METIGIIPARYASSRLPGKPLADIAGKPMIQWVYERVSQALKEVYVATDHEEIKAVVESFGGKAILTGVAHENGTSRCFEASEILKAQGLAFNAVVNIQGDEPFINPDTITLLKETIEQAHVDVATLGSRVKSNEVLFSESNVFLVKDKNDKALYFSRTAIPVVRGVAKEQWLEHHTFLKHLGLYAYKVDALRAYVSLPSTPLEELEKLEQLRWLEHGKSMHVALVEEEGHSVDTQDDLETANRLAKKQL